MMTKTKINKKSGYRLLTLLPLTGFIFVAFSFTNKAAVKSTTSKSLASINQSAVFNKTLNGSQGNNEQLTALQDTAKRKRNASKTSQSLEMPPPLSDQKTSLPPSARVVTAVAPVKMNVLYLGVDNPLNIAVSGVSDDKLIIETDNGAIIKDKGMYVSRPMHVGSARIHVFAEMDGKKLHMGEMEFRVKSVPDPVAKVANQRGEGISRALLLSQKSVIADLENFDFDMEFKVTEFTVEIVVGGFMQDVTVKSDQISDQQKNLIRQVAKGGRVLFTDIKAIGPDGRPRKLSPMIFTIQD